MSKEIPSPRFVNVNMAWQLGGDAELLKWIAKFADVMGIEEARTADNQPLDVQAILGDEWDVRQDLSSAAKAGSVTAVRRRPGLKVLSTRLDVMSDAGHKVQARYQRTTTIRDTSVRRRKRVRVIVGHAALPSTGRHEQAVQSARRAIGTARRWRARAKFMVRWIGMWDCNADPDLWAHQIGAPNHFGAKPMVTCWSEGWGPVRLLKIRRKGTDHFILVLKRKPPVKR